MADAEFDRAAEELFRETMERHPVQATYMGLHEADGQMGHTSRSFHLEEIDFVRGYRQRFASLDPDELSGSRPLDRELALFLADLSLFRLEEVQMWESVPGGAEDLGGALFPLFARNFAPLEERMASIASRLEEATRYLEEVRTRIARPVTLWTEMALEAAERLPAFLDAVQKAAEDGLTGDPVRTVKMARQDALEALEAYQEWLRAEVLPEAREEHILGEERFARLLAIRRLGEPDEVRGLGAGILKRARKELKEVAATIDPDAPVEEVSRRIRSDHPSTFEEVLAEVERVAEEARAFVRDRRLATLPPAERLLVRETPPFLRPVLPFAAYFRPPRFEDVQEGVYIVTPPSDGEEMLQEHNRASIRNTVVHEGYPGHHLQLSSANLNPSLVRALTAGTGTAEMVEGWAHYCEDLMREMDFNDTPEIRFVQLQDIIWRACRVVIDVDLHAGRMTFEEAVDMLVEETGMERPSAVAEVKRYTQNPTYQLSYLLGKHLIQGLRAEVEERMGDGFSHAFFHDAILYGGSVPFFLLRKQVMDKLAKLEEGVEDLQ